MHNQFKSDLQKYGKHLPNCKIAESALHFLIAEKLHRYTSSLELFQTPLFENIKIFWITPQNAMPHLIFYFYSLYRVVKK